MTKEEYIKITNKRLKGSSKKIVIDQINTFYKIENSNIIPKAYKIGDRVFLKKGTLLHGTYKNIEGLKDIVKDGLISSWYVDDDRTSKYPSCVGVWNLKQDYYLEEYINFYSGGTIEYKRLNSNVITTDVIPYNEMNNIMNIVKRQKCFRWDMEQTKEARFLPSPVQEDVQIGIIFDGNNDNIKLLMKNDILNGKFTNKELKYFVSKYYYPKFLKDIVRKNDFFTDRESAILFGIPSCFIEGVLVGRIYEHDENKLAEIKKLLPNCYICNLDGIVIK